MAKIKNASKDGNFSFLLDPNLATKTFADIDPVEFKAEHEFIKSKLSAHLKAELNKMSETIIGEMPDEKDKIKSVFDQLEIDFQVNGKKDFAGEIIGKIPHTAKIKNRAKLEDAIRRAAGNRDISSLLFLDAPLGANPILADDFRRAKAQEGIKIVNGKIYDELNSPLPNVTVKLFDKDLRTETFLGEKSTDTKGFYQISFNSRQAANPEYKTADLLIKVFDTRGILLGQSDIYFNVGEETIINFKIGKTAYTGLSEFDALLQLIKPIMESNKVELGDLEENDKFQDISFLVGETGEEADKIIFLNKAFLLSKPSKIVPDIFYALFRLGFPTELNALLLTKAESISKAIQTATDENIISAKWLKNLDAFVNRFNNLAVEQLVKGDSEQSVVFKKVIGPVLTAAKQKVFVDTYFANEETPEKFWEQLKLQPGFTDGKAIENTKQVLKLNLLTANQPELTQQLFKLRQTDPELKELRGFAKFNKADWAQQITEARVTDFPEWVAGKTAEEKKENYADTLEQLHRRLYPTSFFAYRLKADNNSSIAHRNQLDIFFTKNPNFDLNAGNINKEFAQSDFSAVDKEAVKKEIKTISRLYKLNNDYAVVNKLLSKQLHSATAIVSKYGKQQFGIEFAEALGSETIANGLYQKALSVDKKTTALLAAYKTTHDIPMYAINGTNDAPEGYHEMFGDGELCECDHCQSVYSPAAYFVDLLAFIKSENTTAFEKLLERRPDLDDILLTCQNTNTPLPYIDLVNELLEKQVITKSTPTGTDPEPPLNHSWQTEADAAELDAIPEHLAANAYDPLKTVVGNAVFSVDLPLDLSLEEMRIYTEKLGWNRFELLEAFYGKNDPGKMNDAELAAEYFGFSKAELEIIDGTNPIEVSLPAQPAQVDIKSFLEKTKLSYIELLQLLDTIFLNPDSGTGRLIGINQQAVSGENILTCNLEKLFLAGANDVWLNKFARFIRLWKKTGWNIYDLDRALKVIGLTDFPSSAEFNAKLLLPLFHIEKIHRQFNLPVRQVLVFFGKMDIAMYRDYTKAGQSVIPSLYEQLFRNKAVAELENSPFKESAAELSGELADFKEILSASLGITVADVEVLTEALTEVDNNISIESLSFLYRNALLVKTLNVSVSELRMIISITGKIPVNGIWSTDTLLRFIEDYQILKEAGVKFDNFYSLLNEKIGTDFEFTVPDVFIELLQEKKNELIAIRGNAAINEAARKQQFAAKRNETLEEISSSVAWLLAGENLNGEDKAIKKAVDNFLGDENRQSLELLTIDDFINRLANTETLAADYQLLKSTPLILKEFGFATDKIQWLKETRESTGTAVLWQENITEATPDVYAAFKKLYFLSKLNNLKTKSTDKNWTLLLDNATDDDDSKARYFALLTELFVVPETSLVFLAGSEDEVNNKGRLNLSFPEDYKDGETILELLVCCSIIDKLNAGEEQLKSLLKQDILPEDVQFVKNLLKSRYTSPEWLMVIKPISDKLRTMRRDALAAWLLALPEQAPPERKWQTANDIYKYLLIDTEMAACMISSRIKQAISSVQLFIDRCLMNLEDGVTLENGFADQWDRWRKQYRVWEANRKVFLYPENWIEPELRDDKSPFFKELESQLKQNEVTEETAKEALLQYLQKLDAVANLEMVGLFKDEETDTLHVFGRTQNIPHQYFYRKQQKSVWSAWGKVDVDIEGDHILPVVWNGRLILLWAQFTEKQDSNGGSTSIKQPDNHGSMAMESRAASTYLEMKLAWSEYKNGKWIGKKISKEKLIIDRIYIVVRDHRDNIEYNVYPSKEDCSLSSSTNQEGLFIRVLLRNFKSLDLRTLFGEFHFDFCNSFPVPRKLTNNNTAFQIQNPPGTRVDGMVLSEWNDDHLKLNKRGIYNKYSGEENYGFTILNNTPGTFKLLPEHHEIETNKPGKFFYSNTKNNLFSYSTEIFFPPDLHDNNLDNNLLSLLARKIESPLIPFSVVETNSVSANSHRTSTNTGSFDSDLLTTGVNTAEIDPYENYKGKKYLFQTFYHPYICSFIKALNSEGIDAVYNPAVQQSNSKPIFTNTDYNPTSLVLNPYPVEELDYSLKGSYSLYNWELFFHIPILIAGRLSQNQKFEDARKWLHYIFDPTKKAGDGEGTERFWITKPFRQEIMNDNVSLEELLQLDEHAEDLSAQLSNWEVNPFIPHAVARFRLSAYMRKTVLLYIDNLIKWGDQLFQRDTIESINEATLLYMLAAEILGKKLEGVPPRSKPAEKSFSAIQDQLDRFSNVKTEIELFVSGDNTASEDDNLRMPYFCLPKNDYLLKYWDTVADRLFKIRHCMNIEGVVRQLALFEPPIDPALLVRATAAGLDLDTVLNDINTNLPHYRFQVMLQKANELCNDVKMLGGMFLSAIEKKDAEELALLRSGHELKMLEMVKDLKQLQRDEATENLNSLISNRKVIEERFNYYTTNASAYLNPSEKQYFDSSQSAKEIQMILEIRNYLVSVLHLIPDTKIGSGFTIGATYGGGNLGKGESAAINALQAIASINRIEAESANMKGIYDRRMDDWKFQAKSAQLELKQIDKQIIAAEIRLAIAEKDLENHSLLMEQSREVDDYMRSKFTNAELYDWMVDRISTVYFQSYQLAYATAKKAEKCLQHEMGLETTNYIQFGYWDSLKKGLLSGEKLQYDLRRLENAYLEENRREYEIVKHISLSMLDPLALLSLKSNGTCEFEIPEVLYDMDHPGQYFRRLKSVSISLPCIAGPYTSVSAKLSLVSNRYRKKIGGASYLENPRNDQRFTYNVSAIKSIATSNAQNDSGMFEFNFRDERYLPFEGGGAISTWQLELPTEVRLFDYETISDLVLHVKYTAREGGSDLKRLASETLKGRLLVIKQELGQTGLNMVLNMRRDLPQEWNLLIKNETVGLKIDKTRLPYFVQALDVEVENVMFLAKLKTNQAVFPISVNQVHIDLKKIEELELYQGNNAEIELETSFELSVRREQLENLEELMLIVKYILKPDS